MTTVISVALATTGASIHTDVIVKSISEKDGRLIVVHTDGCVNSFPLDKVSYAVLRR